ncbi:uncharacterized protein KY384_001453 [Bacidia gigantensis]|uniref:uncharacterized protein n=1 Tax=Bacidia gigantensis TaxID=2732470 RepID=UPI001D038D9F|nr:uncharacterized protein KY384_001453 [Bacidia gigantensis]KAG8533712.1 hypothetical protein KY384_001453 [Bacidia gigantensis]
MSFQNYENFPSQQGGPDPGVAAGGPPPQQEQIPGSAGGQYESSGNGQPSSSGGQPQDGEAKTTLWMGELEPWMDENFIRTVWYNMGESVNVKMIRDKFSGNAGYCFVDFATPAAAAKGLTLNGSVIPNSQRPFKLNWASGGGLADRSNDRGPEHSIFVGDLGPEVNEYVLVSLFQNRFPSCKSAKIMTDPISGMSRGYGFVRFSDENDQQRALSEMQGVYCGNRPMRISTATPKNKPGGGALGPMQQGGGGPGGPPGPQMGGMGGYPQMGQPALGFYNQPQPMNQFTDPNNTTVFVGGLSGYVTEDELRSFFQGFGEITYVKIPPGKGCGFVQFVQRHAAEMAINQMQGYPIGNSRVRLSWGRSQNNSGPAGTPYRPAPPPPVFPSMGMPPQHPYGNFAPMKSLNIEVFANDGTQSSPYAAHTHPPENANNVPQGPPGALSPDVPGPADALPINTTLTLIGDKNGKTDQLRFPAFHVQMLQQTWIDPSEPMGRIKLIISEGLQSFGTLEFKKKRNVAMFSFQHAPLALLEDVGIAWPNPGMWYQSMPHPEDYISPTKMQVTDPTIHAHSPRRDNVKIVPLPTLSSASQRGQPNTTVDVSIRNVAGTRPKDSLTRPGAHMPDPFIDEPKTYGPKLLSFSDGIRTLQNAHANYAGFNAINRNAASSSSHDVSMPDYSRSHSPNETSEASRIPSHASTALHHQIQTSYPTSINSQAGSRSLSEWEHALAGLGPVPDSASHKISQVAEQNTIIEKLTGKESLSKAPIGREVATQPPGVATNESSPERIITGGILAPANTRAGSVADTPPGARRSSASKQARDASYSGKQRVTSITTKEDLASSKYSIPRESKKLSKGSRKSAQGVLEHTEELATAEENAHQRSYSSEMPSNGIRSKKEGKAMNSMTIEMDAPPKRQHSLSQTLALGHDKENLTVEDSAILPAGDLKRRRLTPANEREKGCFSKMGISSGNRAAGVDSLESSKSSSPVKHNDVDYLTTEGVMTRAFAGSFDSNL